MEEAVSGSGRKGKGHNREGPEKHHMLRPSVQRLHTVQHLHNPAFLVLVDIIYQPLP